MGKSTFHASSNMPNLQNVRVGKNPIRPGSENVFIEMDFNGTETRIVQFLKKQCDKISKTPGNRKEYPVASLCMAIYSAPKDGHIVECTEDCPMCEGS